MEKKATKKSPSDFLGKTIKRDLSGIPVKIINEDTGDRIGYGCRFDPKTWDEMGAFHKGSAVAYEIYVICTQAGLIDEINHRIEQCPCGEGKSFAPKGVPTWMMPSGALYDLEWRDIVPLGQERMLGLLEAMTEATGAAPNPQSRKRPTSRARTSAGLK